jgi:hypothetical protein
MSPLFDCDRQFPFSNPSGDSLAVVAAEGSLPLRKLLSPKRKMIVKPIRQSIFKVSLFSLTMIAGGYGCSREPSASQSPYALRLALEAPIGSAYPGTRELMDAPSNDPAVNNDRNGVELRP